VLKIPAWIPDRERDERQRALATLHRILGQLIAERRANEDNSVLSMLLQARDEGGTDGLSDAELRDEVMTVFIGGYETSSNALAFTLACLAANPDVARRHREEVDRVLAGRAPQASDLAQMPLNKAVIQEAMRLYPPSWMITREALEDDVINGYPIARGSQVLVSAYGVHHAPDVWNRPNQYDPTRFMPGSPEIDRFAYIPFGGGPRVCLGDQYALTEIQLIVARLVQNVTFQLTPDTRIEAQAHVGLRPRTPLRATIARRNATQTL
jgi:cytochrome P450